VRGAADAVADDPALLIVPASAPPAPSTALPARRAAGPSPS